MMSYPLTRPLPRAERALNETARYLQAEFGGRETAWLSPSVRRTVQVRETKPAVVICPEPRASWVRRVTQSLGSFFL